MRVDPITLVVADYDPAIEFFTQVLGFELVDDFDAAHARMATAGSSS